MSKELVILFSYQERLGRVDQDNKIPVAIRLGETPVPIPNTMVKTQEADGTMLETAWESRWLPGSLKNLLIDKGPSRCGNTEVEDVP